MVLTVGSRKDTEVNRAIKKLRTLLKDPKGVFISRVLVPCWRLITRLRQYLSKHNMPRVPKPPVWRYPEGFSVHSIADTGVRFVDNFLSRDEALRVIEHGTLVRKSTVIGPDGSSILHTHRTSSDTLLSPQSDPLLKLITCRAASLFGLPLSHAEIFSLTRYQYGEYYKSHFDHDGSMDADRLYTLLVYLNDLDPDEGGETLFNALHFAVQPVCGRAVIWNNSDTRGNRLKESVHTALPITREGSEKWVAQLWFRAYKFHPGPPPAERTDPPAGIPLKDASNLRGISVAEPAAFNMDISG
jgi:prolyl 4-hydroxylase